MSERRYTQKKLIKIRRSQKRVLGTLEYFFKARGKRPIEYDQYLEQKNLPNRLDLHDELEEMYGQHFEGND
jgi:hypothetical protein